MFKSDRDENKIADRQLVVMVLAATKQLPKKFESDGKRSKIVEIA